LTSPNNALKLEETIHQYIYVIPNWKESCWEKPDGGSLRGSHKEMT
jgi:hypothetical protein